MPGLINQYSFVLVALLAIGVLAVFLLRDGVRGSDLVAVGSLTLGFVLAFLLLRPAPSAFRQLEQVESQIGTGTPVLLEFQSPY